METENEVVAGDLFAGVHIVGEQRTISLNKFIFLSIISFGAYEVWWIYKAWKFYQQKSSLDISPVARTIFSIFYLHSLLSKTLEYAKGKGYNNSYEPNLLFVGFIIANLLAHLPDPYWLISIFSFLFLVPPFQALNFAKQNSTEFISYEQIEFSSRQVVLAVVGSIFWIIVLFGMYMEA